MPKAKLLLKLCSYVSYVLVATRQQTFDSSNVYLEKGMLIRCGFSVPHFHPNDDQNVESIRVVKEVI